MAGDARSVEVRDAAAWRAWLEEHYADPDGVWVTYRKKTAAGPQDPTYEDLVEEALCFGWVDSQGRTLDAERTSLWFSPRKKGSGWAATNKARIATLTDAGRMHRAGLAVVERAKADGSWTLLDDSEAAREPEDLIAAFDHHRGSRAHWDAFPRGVRKAILQWIALAKTPQTRARRIEETASKAAENVRANQWTPKDRG
jgi:uncharacterized protein YdeI (YjbR/CyaY-like superfamily)